MTGAVACKRQCDLCANDMWGGVDESQPGPVRRSAGTSNRNLLSLLRAQQSKSVAEGQEPGIGKVEGRSFTGTGHLGCIADLFIYSTCWFLNFGLMPDLYQALGHKDVSMLLGRHFGGNKQHLRESSQMLSGEGGCGSLGTVSSSWVLPLTRPCLQLFAYIGLQVHIPLACQFDVSSGTLSNHL